MKRLSLFAVLFALAAPAALTAQDVRLEKSARLERAAALKKERKARLLERRQAREARRAQYLVAKKKRLKQLQVTREARGFRRLKVDGAQVRPAMEKLAKELKWHDNLQAAQGVARRTGKPIVWIHALGELTGVL